MDWMQLGLLVGGSILGAVAHKVATNKTPVIDPANRRPLIDAIRDEVRAVLLSAYPQTPAAPVTPGPAVPSVPAPAPAPQPPTVPVDLNAIVQQLAAVVMHAMTQLALNAQPAPAASTLPAPNTAGHS